MATRLLRGSAKHSYDPVVDVDWEHGLVPGMWFAPPECSTLYGTPWWEQADEAARIELTKHEVASIASTGLWFEVILMQMLLRSAYDGDPSRRHWQYALTEIGDETRHSVMFARMTEAFGVPHYRRRRLVHELGRVFKTTSDEATCFAGVLFAEEMLDASQRAAVDDERVHPMVRQVSRIHVVEEARHIRYAREEAAKQWAAMGRTRRAVAQTYLAGVAGFVTTSLIAPGVYAAVGLDPDDGRHAAAANEHWRATRREWARKPLEFLDSIGAVGANSRVFRRLGMLD